MFVDECVIKAAAGDGGRGLRLVPPREVRALGRAQRGRRRARGRRRPRRRPRHEQPRRLQVQAALEGGAGRARPGQGLPRQGGARRRAQAAARDGCHRRGDGPGRRRGRRGRPADRPVQGRQRRLGQHPFQDLDKPRAQPGQSRPAGRDRESSGWSSSRSRTSASSASPTRASPRSPSAITKARPKTAAYPFTTLQPQIGVIEFADEIRGNPRLLLADIPGLIEGASENRGLGHRFLRHVERCALLLILIDMAGADGRDPRDDYRPPASASSGSTTRRCSRSRGSSRRTRWTCRRPRRTSRGSSAGTRSTSLEISCLEGTGLERLKKELLKRVGAFRRKEKESPAAAA